MDDLEIITQGCRLNAYESEVMRMHAAAAGLQPAVVVNTCAVTAEAVRQAQQTIRRVRREQPGRLIVVTGCAAQIEPQRFAGMAEVDHVVGNGEKMRAETFRALAGRNAPRLTVGIPGRGSASNPGPLSGFAGKPRAWVEVQNGCDHACTFCIIPSGRGRSRSTPVDAVVAQVQHFVERGAVEVVLTGVDLTSYGRDVPGGPLLGDLVAQVLRDVPTLPRLRLSSLDPMEIEDDARLFDVVAGQDRLMPHLHLSVQAGSDLVLKRMRRRHLRGDVERLCATLRRLRPDIVLGADLIAGFPTESDAMFSQTLDLVDSCGLTFLHVFPFSLRAGTPAARMPQVPAAVVAARARRLREAGERAVAARLAGEMGKRREVLVEGGGRGRTPHFIDVDVTAVAGRVGSLVDCHIVGVCGQRLIAAGVP